MTGSSRLSALDAAFLGIETHGTHMHIGALAVFETGALRHEDGGIDFDRIQRHVAGTLDRLPHYRQRLVAVPGLGQPSWIDDEQFRLSYHVRHTSLPRPGSERQLKRLAGRVFSQRLDRDRPLWELWVVEGLDDDRFAMVMKTHHCLVDGMGGVELLAALFGPEARTPSEWTPRPPPGGLSLLKDELAHRAKRAWDQRGALREALTHPREALSSVAESAHQTSELVRFGLTPCDRTLLNPKQVGPHRRFECLRLELSELKAVKTALGGKLNDAVLATCAGGIGRYLERRGVDVAALTDFRTLVPVDVRHGKEGAGNRVGMMFAKLPLAERDPRRRFERVLEETAHVKTEGGHAQASELVEDLADWAAPSLVTELFRYAGWAGTFNVVITNVPGPPFPLSLLGSKMTAIYPLVPLFRDQGLGIALFSYDGGMFFGINADWSLVADAHLLADDLRASFDELHALI